MNGLYSAIRGSWHHYLGGQFWVGGWFWGSPSYVSFLREVGGLELSAILAARADAYAGAAESACWWWPHRDFVMACERPTRISRDENGALHSWTEKAIEWPDGWGLYRVHGVRVPDQLVTEPDTWLTLARIDAEPNAEVRRLMIERYGLARYVREAGFAVLDQDVDPLGQPRRLLSRAGLTVVELTNSTVDADGTRRVYHVPCHPELRPIAPITFDAEGRATGRKEGLGEPQKPTALNAVASTYGLRGEQYRPSVET
jgi:hypothetical protein